MHPRARQGREKRSVDDLAAVDTQSRNPNLATAARGQAKIRQTFGFIAHTGACHSCCLCWRRNMGFANPLLRREGYTSHGLGFNLWTQPHQRGQPGDHLGGDRNRRPACRSTLLSERHDCGLIQRDDQHIARIMCREQTGEGRNDTVVLVATGRLGLVRRARFSGNGIAGDLSEICSAVRVFDNQPQHGA